MSTPVFYHSGMAGFPAGNARVAGGLIAVLDACLVDGTGAFSFQNVLAGKQYIVVADRITP